MQGPTEPAGCALLGGVANVPPRLLPIYPRHQGRLTGDKHPGLKELIVSVRAEKNTRNNVS